MTQEILFLLQSVVCGHNTHDKDTFWGFFLKVKEKVRVTDRPLGLAELLHACEPLPEVAVLSETVVVGGQLEQFDLSDHLELLQADRQPRRQEGRRK